FVDRQALIEGKERVAVVEGTTHHVDESRAGDDVESDQARHPIRLCRLIGRSHHVGSIGVVRPSAASITEATSRHTRSR
ncbi:MAG: hypothetical protein RIS41_93, partial [Actinomycetota bacterium]